MKKTTLSFGFSRLWNTEYPLMMARILEITKKHNPSDLHLERAVKRLEDLKPSWEQIQVQVKASGITNQITDTDDLRDRLTTFIFKQIASYKQLGIVPFLEGATVLDTWIKKFNSKMVDDNYTTQTEKTNQLLSESKSITEVASAINTLSLSFFFDRLKETNIQFEQLFRERNAEMASVPTIDIRSIRKQCDEAANKLFAAILYCKEEYEDKDYTPLINELSELLSYHKNQINARKKTPTTDKPKTGEESASV